MFAVAVFASAAPAAASANVTQIRTNNIVLSSTSSPIWVDSVGYSFDGIRLVMQSDGNLVMYRVTFTSPGEQQVAIWHTATWGNPGSKAYLQSDGHIYVRNAGGQLIYSNGVWGYSGTALVLTGDGRLAIYTKQSQKLWDSYSGAATNQSRAPFTGIFADGRYHSHNDNESNASQEADWKARMNGAGGEAAYEPTRLVFYQDNSPDTSTDIRYRQVPNSQLPAGAAAVVECQPPGPVNNTCDQFHIRFGDDLANSHSHIKNNGVCHEVGHTVGFGDGGLQATSCMTGGMTSRLNSYEKYTNIDGKY